MDSDITQTQTSVGQGELDDLNRRIDAFRWPVELAGAGWEYGVEQGYLRRLAAYWRDGFDWREQERRLNAVPQYTTVIDGHPVHFLHARSADPEAVPLILTHGWPSTVADFLDVVGPLTDPAGHGARGAPAFHVVAPSIPGFPFSGPPRDRGWDSPRVARTWAELMSRLGYERYLAQGGDAGAIISPELARAFPDRVLGVHVNALVGAMPDWESENPLEGLTEEQAARVYAQGAEWEQRSGYAVVNSTRPHTVGYALNDSPVGLLAWNMEWFVDYDPGRGVQTPVSDDALLTNVTAFWLTGTAPSAARLYKESGDEFFGGPVSGVPTAVAVFPGDGALRPFAERSNRVVRWTEFDRGGHFAALQAPDLLVGDIRAFAAELAGA